MYIFFRKYFSIYIYINWEYQRFRSYPHKNFYMLYFTIILFEALYSCLWNMQYLFYFRDWKVFCLFSGKSGKYYKYFIVNSKSTQWDYFGLSVSNSKKRGCYLNWVVHLKSFNRICGSEKNYALLCGTWLIRLFDLFQIWICWLRIESSGCVLIMSGANEIFLED